MLADGLTDAVMTNALEGLGEVGAGVSLTVALLTCVSVATPARRIIAKMASAKNVYFILIVCRIITNWSLGEFSNRGLKARHAIWRLIRNS